MSHRRGCCCEINCGPCTGATKAHRTARIVFSGIIYCGCFDGYPSAFNCLDNASAINGTYDLTLVSSDGDASCHWTVTTDVYRRIGTSDGIDPCKESGTTARYQVSIHLYLGALNLLQFIANNDDAGIFIDNLSAKTCNTGFTATNEFTHTSVECDRLVASGGEQLCEAGTGVVTFL